MRGFYLTWWEFEKNVAQFIFWVFSPNQIKTSHLNTITCRIVPCGLWNQHQSWGEEQFQSERRTPLASDTMPQCWRVSVAKVIVEWNVELLVCCGAQQRRRRGGGRIIQHAQRRPFVHFVFFVELMRFWGYSSYRKNLVAIGKKILLIYVSFFQ